MSEDVQTAPHNEDLDRAAKQDKHQIIIWLLVALLIGVATWLLIAQSNASKLQATIEARQKFTLAEQIADACANHDSDVDLGGLCASATIIVKEGPPGPEGPIGPPAFPFTFDFQFYNTTFTCTITASDALASCVSTE